MEVQAPGFRYYHSLAKMDEMFAEDRLRHHVDMPWMTSLIFIRRILEDCTGRSYYHTRNDFMQSYIG